jgi:hypothetical protein
MFQIIGLSGFKRSGKSTFAKELVEKHNFVEYSFAQPLKKMTQDLFEFTNDQLENNKEVIDNRWGYTPREIFQKMGSEIMRDYIPQVFPNFPFQNSFWIQKFIMFCDNFRNNYPDKTGIVISDVRFTDEADMIRKMGGQIIRIEKPDLKNIDNHISEFDLSIIQKHRLNQGINSIYICVIYITLLWYITNLFLKHILDLNILVYSSIYLFQRICNKKNIRICVFKYRTSNIFFLIALLFSFIFVLLISQSLHLLINYIMLYQMSLYYYDNVTDMNYKFDIIIQNDGTLDDFKNKIYTLDYQIRSMDT